MTIYFSDFTNINYGTSYKKLGYIHLPCAIPHNFRFFDLIICSLEKNRVHRVPSGSPDVLPQIFNQFLEDVKPDKISDVGRKKFIV